jgi:hypothetical protein
MNQQKLLRALFAIALFTIGLLICNYYWSNESLDAIRRLPMYIMFYALGYVILQIIRRILFKENDWWDWLYYIGLAVMMIPTFFASESNLSVLNFLADFGTIFLVIPVFFDGRKLINSSK